MIEILKKRFQDNQNRHPGIRWETVEKRLMENKDALSVLRRMEESVGEPDVIGLCEKTGQVLFADCCKESPIERRSLCYDEEALAKRSKNPPKGSAMKQAEEMGVTLMSEELYFRLQSLGEFDLKTSSWLLTPKDLREKGGALFGERRYGRTFVFHNGADSYYSVRGWRGCLLV